MRFSLAGANDGECGDCEEELVPASYPEVEGEPPPDVVLSTSAPGTIPTWVWVAGALGLGYLLLRR